MSIGQKSSWRRKSTPPDGGAIDSIVRVKMALMAQESNGPAVPGEHEFVKEVDFGFDGDYTRLDIPNTNVGDRAAGYGGQRGRRYRENNQLGIHITGVGQQASIG